MMRILIIFLLVISAQSMAEKKTQNQQAVDQIFVAWDNTSSPGAGLGVFKDGKVVYARGYGMANLEYDIPNDENSVFRIGSTSKQFTAACIILLNKQGKLKLTDTLNLYYPEFPEYAKNITVQHLLNHTSGVRDYLTLASLKWLGDDDYYQDQDVEQWLSVQQSLNFEPGEEEIYSNSGYWLLGQIVQKASGMDMAQYAEQEIFKPLGMHNTHFHNDHNKIVKNRASGYQPTSTPGQYRISMTNLDMIGDGGIFTTIADIKKWDDAFYHSKILDEDFWQAMTQVGELNNGEKLDYASGLIMGEYKGLKTISHGGAFVGFRAELLRFPEQKFTVAVFANRGDANPTGMAYQVADVYLTDEFQVEAKDGKGEKAKNTKPNKDKKPEVSFEPEQVTGHYELRTGLQIEVTNNGRQLHALQHWNKNEYDLTVISENSNTYQIGDDESIQFTFVDLKEGKTQAISIMQGRESIWKRVEPIDVSAVDVNEFTGNYYSEELRVYYQIYTSEGLVYLKVGNNTAVEVSVTGVDQLSLLSSVANFYRKDGQVKGFYLDAGRVKNLKFVKQ